MISFRTAATDATFAVRRASPSPVQKPGGDVIGAVEPAERSAAMVQGIADLYETKPDFHQRFGSPATARFAATALRLHVGDLP